MTDLTLVPPRRLGALLAEARQQHSLSLGDLALRSDGSWSPTELEKVERGLTALSDDEVEMISDLYGVDAGIILPQRSLLTLDMEQGRLGVDDVALDLDSKEIDAILERYLSLLYLLRSLKPGTALTLRDRDLLVLSETLEQTLSDLERRLGQLMVGASVEEKAGLFGRRISVPAAGLLVAITAVGSLVLINEFSAESPVSPRHGEASALVASGETLTSSTSIVRSPITEATPKRLIVPSVAAAVATEDSGSDSDPVADSDSDSDSDSDREMPAADQDGPADTPRDAQQPVWVVSESVSPRPTATATARTETAPAEAVSFETGPLETVPLEIATPVASATPEPQPQPTAIPTSAPAPTVAPAPTAAPAPTVAPAPTAAPAPTVAPAPTAPAPTAAAVTGAASLFANLGAQAESLISYNWRAVIPGWDVRYEGDNPGYRGLTNTTNRTITIYINPGDTPSDIAGILAHEVAHAIDVDYLSANQREQWLNARGLPMQWWPGSGLNDFSVGAGDFAEAIANYLVGSPSDSAYGSFTQDQLQLAASFLP